MNTYNFIEHLIYFYILGLVLQLSFSKGKKTTATLCMIVVDTVEDINSFFCKYYSGI